MKLYIAEKCKRCKGKGTTLHESGCWHVDCHKCDATGITEREIEIIEYLEVN